MSIQGKTIVFTGKISRPRHEFQRLVEEHGGIAGSDVSSHTDYLVVGEKPGSKLFRANMLGIRTITEEEFQDLIKEEPQIQQKIRPEDNPCHSPSPLTHFWFRKVKKPNGDIVEDCLCGAVLITHPNGKFEKHEPKSVLEWTRRYIQQRKAERESIENKQREQKRQKEIEEKKIIKFIESLTPEQREELNRQAYEETKLSKGEQLDQDIRNWP